MTAAGRVAAVLAAHAGIKFKPGARIHVAPDRVVLDGADAHAVVTEHRRYELETPRFAERFLFVAGGKLPARDRPIVLTFGERHGVPLCLDPGLVGWPGAVALEEGHVGADDLIVGLRPELGSLGGVGAVVLRCQHGEIVHLLGRDKLEITVPPTRYVRVVGRLPRWVGPFDVAVAILAAVPPDGAVLELQGDTIAGLSVPDRLALCQTLAHGGRSALVPPDDVTAVWLRARGGKAPKAPPEADAADGEATFLDARRISLAATLGDPTGEVVVPGPEAGHPVDEVVLGGRLEDLRLAAEAMSERSIREGLTLSIVPATRRTLLHAIEEGLAAAFVRAGALILTPGAPAPPALKRTERIVTLPTGGRDILCGPAVAAASAILGQLVDPESMRRQRRRQAAQR